MVVPGNFPIGCFPIYLTASQTNNTDAFDKFHCLKILNNLSTYSNDHLKQAIEELKKDYPNMTIAYGNCYNAFEWILNHAPLLGEFFKILIVNILCNIIRVFSY